MAQRLVPSLGRAITNKMVTQTMRSSSMMVRSTPPSYSSSYCLGRVWGIGCNIQRYTFPGVSSTTSLLPEYSSPVSPPPTLANHQQTRGFASKKHKWVLRRSKGFRGRANRCFRIAIRRLEKSWQYAYRDRKVKKRQFRKLWIQRLNAGVRQHGISYSNFINMQGKSGVVLDRKILSGLAMYEPFSFKAVVDVVEKMSAEAKAAEVGAGK